MGLLVSYHRDRSASSHNVHWEAGIQGGVKEGEADDDSRHGSVDDCREVTFGVLHVAQNEADLDDEKV